MSLPAESSLTFITKCSALHWLGRKLLPQSGRKGMSRAGAQRLWAPKRRSHVSLWDEAHVPTHETWHCRRWPKLSWYYKKCKKESFPRTPLTSGPCFSQKRQCMPLIPDSRRQRQAGLWSVSLRPSRSTLWVPGHPKLHRMTLSQKYQIKLHCLSNADKSGCLWLGGL